MNPPGAKEMLTGFNFQRMKDINDWGIFRRLCHEHALMTNLQLVFWSFFSVDPGSPNQW